MKLKITNTMMLIVILMTVGCNDMLFNDKEKGTTSSNTPEWANQILSRSTNLNLLEGSWIYSSVYTYDNTDCSGNGQTVDYSGTIVYNNLTAVRSSITVYSYSDIVDDYENYTLNDFQNDCVEKDGVVNSDGNCEVSYEEFLEYYLTDNGYCEVYTKEEYSVTYCGSIDFISDDSVNIIFTWDSDNSKWKESGCKEVELTSQN